MNEEKTTVGSRCPGHRVTCTTDGPARSGLPYHWTEQGEHESAGVVRILTNQCGIRTELGLGYSDGAIHVCKHCSGMYWVGE